MSKQVTNLNKYLGIASEWTLEMQIYLLGIVCKPLISK